MLVVVILGIVAAVGVPAMLRSIAGNRLRSAASTVVKSGRYARSMAVMRQTSVQLVFHPKAGLIDASGSGDVHLTRELDRVHIARVTVEGRDASAADESVPIVYYRNGRCQPYTVEMEDDQGRRVKVSVDPLGGARTEGGKE